MKVSRTSSFKSIYVLTDKEISKLYHIISDYCGQPKIAIHCKDQLKREYDDLDSLLAYENMKGKEITSISFISYGKGDYSERNVYLTFDSGEITNIYINMDGPERDMTEFNEKLNERLESARPWYSFISKLDFIPVLSILYLSLMAIIITMSLIGIIKVVASERSETSKSIGYFIGAIPFIVGVLFNRIKSKIFPSSSFAINQGQKRYHNLESFRLVILGGLFVSIIASLFLAIF